MKRLVLILYLTTLTLSPMHYKRRLYGTRTRVPLKPPMPLQRDTIESPELLCKFIDEPPPEVFTQVVKKNRKNCTTKQAIVIGGAALCTLSYALFIKMFSFL